MSTSPSSKRRRLEEGANGKTRREHKVALCVIAGDNCFDDGIVAMLKSCVGKIGAVFISFNGTDQGVFEGIASAVHDIFGDIPGELATFEWKDDFALARNHSFMIAKENANGPKFDAEWLIWLDCDDTLPTNFDIVSCINELNDRHAHGGFVYYNYYSDEFGVQAGHYKDRIFRADVDWKWIFPIHEVCDGPLATRMIKLDEQQFGSVTHQRRPEEIEAKRSRNRRIIARWFKQEPDNPRVMLQMAHETFEAAVQNGNDETTAAAALELYKKFIDKMDPDDDAYLANLHVGRLYRMLGKHQSAINIFLQGIKMMPTWPACYVEIAETYFEINYFELAVQWAQTCYRATETPKDTFIPIEPLDAVYRPLMIEGAAQMEQENYAKALKAFQRAHTIRADEFTKDKINLAADHLRREGEKLGARDPIKQREQNWGKSPDKSVAFFTRPHFEKWDTRKLETEGLGGTETCVIRLAQRLADRGWRVVIFGTPEREGTDSDGIEWYNSSRWHPDEPFTATISVRFPELFDANVKSKVKVLWTHDVNMGDVRWGDGKDRFSNPDVIVAPSPWAIMHLGAVYDLEDRGDSELHVIFNGFDVDLYDSGVNKQWTQSKMMNRFIYASSPDRGLVRLLDFWPKIRERMPSAELHVYYGWEAIDKIIDAGLPTGPQLAHFKKTVQAQIKRLGGEKVGIIWHGRVGQQELATAMKRASIMPYPANFMETFGIVFAQGMAAGCLPVTCDLGALPAMIDDPRLIVTGAAPDSEVYERLFLDKLFAVMEMDPAERYELERGLNERVQDLNYASVADSWERLFAMYIERNDNPVKVMQSGT